MFLPSDGCECEYRIKQEAIKWVKSMREERPKDWIKNFFNITGSASPNSSQKKEIGSMTHSREVEGKDPDELGIPKSCVKGALPLKTSGLDIPLINKVFKRYGGTRVNETLIFHSEDVAEAVRKLKIKVSIDSNFRWIHDEIDKIFGEFK